MIKILVQQPLSYEDEQAYSIDACFDIDEDATATDVIEAFVRAMILESYHKTSIHRCMLDYLLSQDVDVHNILYELEKDEDE